MSVRDRGTAVFLYVWWCVILTKCDLCQKAEIRNNFYKNINCM